MNKISFSAQKQDKSPLIVLTADERMMSKYRWGIFVGFSTCMPKGIPMNFVSMRGSALDNKETFTMKKMTPEHWQLFGECIDHDFTVVPELISIYKTGSSGAIKSLLLRAGAKYITNALQKYVGQMKRGESPTERTKEGYFGRVHVL